MIDNLVKKKEGEDSVVTWIKRRIKRNQNVISLTSGATGSGKSYADLSLALKVDPNFDVKKQVVFKLSDFMRLINSEWFKKLKWKQVIFEEAQISISNRSWQSAVNKMLNYVLSTFRHQNIILHFNAPYRDFLDSQSMKLVHIIFDTRGIDRKKNMVRVRPLLQQYNSKLKKTYEHSIHTILPDKKVRPVGMYSLGKPPKEVCEAYESMKTEFTQELNKEILMDADELDGKKKSNGIDTRKPLTAKQKLVMKTYQELGKVILVAKKLGVANSAVSDSIKYARLKGYTLENTDFKDMKGISTVPT